MGSLPYWPIMSYPVSNIIFDSMFFCAGMIFFVGECGDWTILSVIMSQSLISFEIEQWALREHWFLYCMFLGSSYPDGTALY